MIEETIEETILKRLGWNSKYPSSEYKSKISDKPERARAIVTSKLISKSKINENGEVVIEYASNPNPPIERRIKVSRKINQKPLSNINSTLDSTNYENCSADLAEKFRKHNEEMDADNFDFPLDENHSFSIPAFKTKMSPFEKNKLRQEEESFKDSFGNDFDLRREKINQTPPLSLTERILRFFGCI